MNKKVPRKSHMRKTKSGKIVPVRKHMMKVNNKKFSDRFTDEELERIKKFGEIADKIDHVQTKVGYFDEDKRFLKSLIGYLDFQLHEEGELEEKALEELGWEKEKASLDDMEKSEEIDMELDTIMIVEKLDTPQMLENVNEYLALRTDNRKVQKMIDKKIDKVYRDG